jgi:L-rhamnose mutarotase
MIRVGRVIGLKPEKLGEYKKYHTEIWPEVLKKITEYNIRNYSIFYHNGKLFSYFEYIGNNYKKDMEEMACEPTIKKWRILMADMQIPLENEETEKLWADMEEVFHHD